MEPRPRKRILNAVERRARWNRRAALVEQARRAKEERHRLLRAEHFHHSRTKNDRLFPVHVFIGALVGRIPPADAADLLDCDPRTLRRLKAQVRGHLTVPGA